MYKAQLSVYAWMPYSLVGWIRWLSHQRKVDIKELPDQDYALYSALLQLGQASKRSFWRNSSKVKSECLGWWKAKKNQDGWTNSSQTLSGAKAPNLKQYNLERHEREDIEPLITTFLNTNSSDFVNPHIILQSCHYKNPGLEIRTWYRIWEPLTKL